MQLKDAQVKEVSKEAKSGAARSMPSGVPFIFLGWVLAAVSLVFIPILFGALGLITGYCVKTVFKRDMAGFTIMVMSVVGAIFGMILGYNT